MLERIKIFISKNSLLIVASLISIVVFFIMILLGVFTPKKVYTKVTQKIDNTLDKISDKVNEYDSKVQEIKITKKIEQQKAEEEKNKLETELNNIKNISDREKRLKRLIQFNKSIEVK